MKATAKKPTSPAEYLDSLPTERRAAVERLRRVLRQHLPRGFEETVGYGMLAWVVPHRIFPAGYHCDPTQPLPFINLASQKQYLSLYHMGLYDPGLVAWLKAEWPKHSDAKLDMGKCCVRLKDPEKIPFALFGELAEKITPEQWVKHYQAARGQTATRKAKPARRAVGARKRR
ncbi:MAG: DUF1801 domain-containing protein [Deltaproteobacteria bacterium]|nr:DUF1801 domain-containing protein [Deltaproteobacteria bacterium]